MKYPPDETAPVLYNLIADPHEQNNLAAKKPELVARLSKRIADWWPVTERKIVGSN